MGKADTEQIIKQEKKGNQEDTGRIKIAGIVYGTRNLVDCMEAVIKLYMEK